MLAGLTHFLHKLQPLIIWISEPLFYGKHNPQPMEETFNQTLEKKQQRSYPFSFNGRERMNIPS